MELGVLSLSDLQSDPATGQRVSPRIRTQDIISYGILADQLGLDVFALGERHSLDFAVSSPAVTLAAVAQATGKIRLTSAVTVLSTADPVRVHQTSPHSTWSAAGGPRSSPGAALSLSRSACSAWI